MIQPQSVTLLPGGSQQFVSDADDVTWALSQTLGEIDGHTGFYRAPRNVWISQTVDVTTRTADGVQTGRATVTVTSAKSWMALLGVFWAIFSVALLWKLFTVWPAPAVPPSVEVYPPVATLPYGDSLQFLSSATGSDSSAVLWTTAAESQITPSGVFTAPPATPATQPKAALPKPLAVTATRESDRTQIASAQVYIHDRKLVMDRSVVDATALPTGTLIELRALGPSGAETGLNWYLSGPGKLEAGKYTVQDKSAAQAVVTAVDPAGGRQAAAVIKLISGLPASDRPSLWLVLVMGALGGVLAAARSFVNYVGNRNFAPSWAFFYLFQPFFGAGMALLVFFAYRIGAVAGPQGASPTNPFALAFVAGMVGLFADEVMGKLHGLMQQLFQGHADSDSRTDKMGASPPAPTIASLAVNHGNLIITGANFAADATVSVNGSGLPVTANTATSLTVALPAALSAAGTKLDVMVNNPVGGNSSVMSVTV